MLLTFVKQEDEEEIILTGGLSRGPTVKQHGRHQTPSKVPASDHVISATNVRPSVQKHFIKKTKLHGMAQVGIWST